MDKNNMSILTFYTISPMHAGSGDSVATVDLPIQRERHTNYPCVHASAVKGAMRAHFREFVEPGKEKAEYGGKQFKQAEKLVNFIFGSDKGNDEWKGEFKDDSSIDSIPGAISVSDAKLLAFPMRSNIAPFIFVTCPNILHRLKNDLEFCGISAQFYNYDLSIKDDNAKILKGELKDEKIILEDAVVAVVEIKKEDSAKEDSANIEFLNANLPELTNLLLISDEMFDYCISSCTEIQTNIKIDSKTGTAAEGALRYQEFLPSDSVLYIIINFKGQRDMNDLKPGIIENHVKGIIKDFMQIGGDETLGKGICKIDWVSGDKDEPKAEDQK